MSTPRRIANHESLRTTKLYDRTNDAISLDEIERILIWRKSYPRPPSPCLGVALCQPGRPIPRPLGR